MISSNPTDIYVKGFKKLRISYGMLFLKQINYQNWDSAGELLCAYNLHYNLLYNFNLSPPIC